jgi:hypothetical protein
MVQPMRRYDDPVEVRKHDETPDQFLWRGRLWQVREVVSHWVETGSWWRPDADALVATDLLGEREVWRVAAARGRADFGVFDLSFDWSSGDWRLAGAVD